MFKEPGQFATLKQATAYSSVVICSIIMKVASTVFGAVSVFIPLYSAEVVWCHAELYLILYAGVIVLHAIWLFIASTDLSLQEASL